MANILRPARIEKVESFFLLLFDFKVSTHDARDSFVL